MTAGWIALLLAWTLFALVNTATASAAWAAWPVLWRHLARRSATARAGLILLWRVTPLAASVAVAVATTCAFVLHEPRGMTEPVGVALRALAVIGGGLALAGAVRLAGSLIASEWLALQWTRTGAAVEWPGAGGPAWVIDADFPIVAVVGIRRPRLVVARSVMQGCTPNELAAIAAHEQGHRIAADNVKRLCLQSVIDVLSATRRGREAAARWQEAAEEAADDHAASRDVRAVDLASALVTVGRLAAGRRAIGPLPASVLYRGGAIERRVQRLLAGGAAAGTPPSRRGGRTLGIGLATVAAGLIMAGAGRAIYHGAEWLVRSLP